jgi:hypothetical protein
MTSQTTDEGRHAPSFTVADMDTTTGFYSCRVVVSDHGNPVRLCDSEVKDGRVGFFGAGFVGGAG